MLAFSLATAVLFTGSVPMSHNLVQVQAASVYENENLLVNPDFDGSEEFQPAGGSHAGNWFAWAGPVKTQEEFRSGTTSAKLPQTDAALEQDVPGLVEGMTYEFKVWAKLSGTTNSGSHYIGVKNYGGAEIKQKVDSTEWKEYTLEFTYSGSADARVYCWIEADGGATCYLDDASLTAKGDIQRVSVANGQLQVTFAEDYAGSISKEQFCAVYKSSVDPETIHTMEFTAESVEGKTLTLSYDAIEALPVLQTITLNLTYTGAGQNSGRTFTLDYTIAESGEELVMADIENVTAVNGEITVLLTQNPTIKPIAQDFVWQYKIGDGEFKTLNIDEFSYVAEERTITAGFPQVRGLLQEDSVVTVKVTYGENVASAEFTLPQSESLTYYVSAEGNDSNAGTSEDTPIQTIDKLNAMTFYPGDQILFRKGDTFVGCFKPNGSGSEEHPITVGSYGEGDKPVLQPGADFTVPYLMSANALEVNPTVNYVIWFYNVEYWEVRDLELEDPKHEQTYLNPGNEYRSGITIQAEDAGTLEHIYVDHMEIHGFHGPHTNIGKSSGGITMNVITDLEITSDGRQKGENCVPTQINDIRITNCEIYNVGRSGINFLTPWSYREGEKWGPFNYGTRGFDYLPYEDFYMGNNYIHDIDGDGTIIDNCADAVSEYNLVTRCVLNTNNAAVGMFNWNSDRTTFQYNEVFDIRYGTNDSYHLNDSQGIEIDALNDGTLVQYNYVHDNTGGFMMLCNISDEYRSFDGIIRYNISQNDYAHPRQGLFDIYSANWGTEVYNNNFYLTDRAISTNGYGSHVNAGELFLFSAAGAGDTMKFYNNIFYYAGETPATVNTFGDQVIDWRSNIFYNFANMPENDNAAAPNLAVDPMWNNPGAGSTGTYTDGKEYLGYQTDLSCYYLKEGSPAINAGTLVENNGGKDYFGNPVEGIVDIGAYESGSIALKVVSGEYVVDQSAKSITIKDTKTAAEELLTKLISEKGVTVSVKRNGVVLTKGTLVEEGDTVTVSLGKEAVSYTIAVREESVVTKIPQTIMRVTAGSEENSADTELTPASNAIDGNAGTIWHSAWNGTPAEDRWITIELTEDYRITGYEYMPRNSGGENGIITGYEIYTSNTNNGSDWVLAAEGTDWAKDTAVKTVMFEQPVQAKYVKLLATESYNNFVSAAEIGLFGERVYTEKEQPSAPVLTVNAVSSRTVELYWTESSDGQNGSGISEYRLKQNGEVIARFAANAREYIVGGLQPETEYSFEIVAVDRAGNEAKSETVKVTTMQASDLAELLGYTLSLEGTIGVNFHMQLGDEVIADAEKGAYMNFTLDGKECSKVYVKDATYVNEADGYVFKCGVPVKDMDTEITAQIILSDGRKGSVYTYKVKDYADYIVGGNGGYSEETIALVEAMSDFGDYASAYFADETVGAIPEVTEAELTALETYKGTVPEDSSYYGSSLLLKSNTIIRHYFTEKVTEDAAKKGDLYYIESEGIPAHELGKSIVTEVGDMEITYSPLSYAYIALGRDGDADNLTSLMRAMYQYYQAAQEYLALETNE